MLGPLMGLLLLPGLISSESFEQSFAYLLIVFAAVLPGVLWIRMGAPGIPVLPVAASAYVPAFALPIISGHEALLSYAPWEVERSVLTVVLFLLTATLAWRMLASGTGSNRALAVGHFHRSQGLRLTFIGLAVGCLFHLSVMAGWLAWVGSFFGFVRSVSIALTVVACFMAGVLRARGLLYGRAWGAAVAAICLLIVLVWSSLFLVSGVVYILASVLGYVLTSRRIPWLAVGAALVVIAVLHAGKGEMRARYWAQDSNTGEAISPVRVPALAAEWFAEGVTAVANGDLGQNALDRASVLQMLLRAQTETPDPIEFLGGETYAMLPAIIVPRFIDSEKPASQIGMDLLNLHYGLLDVEGAAVTAIGWGLVAEAYANFGYSGVIGMALFLGICCGLLGIWGANAEFISPPTLVSIVVMMGLINLEADFIQLATSLFHSIISVVIFVTLYGWFRSRQGQRAALEARSP